MRTEEQKATKAPIELKFGETTYKVKPLNIIKGHSWRVKLNEVMGPIAQEFQAGQSVTQTLGSALLRFPEKIQELIFEYDPSLPQEEIATVATDEQMSTAFSEVMMVAFPYLAPLVMVTKILRPTSPQ